MRGQVRVRPTLLDVEPPGEDADRDRSRQGVPPRGRRPRSPAGGRVQHTIPWQTLADAGVSSRNPRRRPVGEAARVWRLVRTATTPHRSTTLPPATRGDRGRASRSSAWRACRGRPAPRRRATRCTPRPSSTEVMPDTPRLENTYSTISPCASCTRTCRRRWSVSPARPASARRRRQACSPLPSAALAPRWPVTGSRLRRAGARNPVFVLDEIDRLDDAGAAATLVELLDPAHGATFRDHYLDVPLDLSGALFVATATNLGSVPATLTSTTVWTTSSTMTMNSFRNQTRPLPILSRPVASARSSPRPTEKTT